MASSRKLSEGATAGFTMPIYERVRGEASDARLAMTKREQILIGAVTGGAVWLLLDLIGVPKVFGLGSESGLIPLILIGTLAARSRFKWVMPSIAFLILVVVAVVSYTPLIAAPARSFIRSDPVPESADAVVVLSSGVSADGYLTQEGLDRTLKGVELVGAGIAPTIVFTLEEKGSGAKRYNATRDQVKMAKLAKVSDVIFTPRVKSTHDEAMEVAKLARAKGWKRIALVTSPFHTKRACATFEKVHLTVSCLPSDSRDVAVKRLVYPHDRLGAFAMWLYETAGTLRYRQLGWI